LIQFVILIANPALVAGQQPSSDHADPPQGGPALRNRFCTQLLDRRQQAFPLFISCSCPSRFASLSFQRLLLASSSHPLLYSRTDSSPLRVHIPAKAPPTRFSFSSVSFVLGLQGSRHLLLLLLDPLPLGRARNCLAACIHIHRWTPVTPWPSAMHRRLMDSAWNGRLD